MRGRGSIWLASDSLFLLFLLAGIHAFDSPRMLVRSWRRRSCFFGLFHQTTGLAMAVALSANALLLRKRFERVAFPLVFGVLVLGSLVGDARADGRMV